MNTIMKFSTLVLVVIALSACGRIGELESVKAQVALVDQEIDIMPHNS